MDLEKSLTLQLDERYLFRRVRREISAYAIVHSYFLLSKSWEFFGGNKGIASAVDLKICKS